MASPWNSSIDADLAYLRWPWKKPSSWYISITGARISHCTSMSTAHTPGAPATGTHADSHGWSAAPSARQQPYFTPAVSTAQVLSSSSAPETAWRIDSTTISATINPHELQHVGVEPGNRCWLNLVSRGRFGPGGMRSRGDADAGAGDVLALFAIA